MTHYCAANNNHLSPLKLEIMSNIKENEYFYVITNGIPFAFLNDKHVRIVKGASYIAITSEYNTIFYPKLSFTELTDDEKIRWSILGLEGGLETPNF